MPDCAPRYQVPTIRGPRPWKLPKYKTALIVGAGEGLSASLARLFAREGISVALAARKIEKLGALCTETGARAFACDATEADEVERLFGMVEREIGTPDIVVYNASGRARGAFTDLVPADVANAIAVSAFGGFLVAQQAATRMLPNKQRRDPVHRRLRQRQGLSAVGAVRDGQVRAARARPEHGARIVAAGYSRRRISSSTAASAARRAPSLPTGRTRCSIPTPLR